MKHLIIFLSLLFFKGFLEAQCTLTITSPNSIFCIGSGPMTLTASGATTYSWSTGATTTTISINPTVQNSYTYTVTGTKGCFATATIVISAKLPPTVTISPASPTICSGSAITLTAGGASTFTWNTSATTTTISVTPTTSTNYSVTGTTASTGCTNTAVRTVTVINPISVSPASATICSGNSTVLTATGSSTYSWSTGATTASISVTPTVTTTYTVLGTTGSCTKTLSVTITVNALPSLTISPSSPTLCSGSALTLTVAGASTYTWNTGANTSTISVSPTANTGYSVTATGTNNCQNTAATTVTVSNQLAVSPVSSTICAGSSVALIASGSTTYSWSTGATTASISASPTVTTTYTVKGTTGSCVKTLSITVTVNAIPSVSISASSSTLCAGNTATLTASGATTYTWNTSATTTIISVTPTVTTSYTVTGTTNGCSKTATTTVSVTALPTVTISPASPTICLGSSVTLTASGASTYTWSTGVTTTTLTKTPIVNTTFTVTGTATSGCTNTAVKTVTVINQLQLSNLTPTLCITTSATLTATGSTSYSWNTGATTSTIAVSPTVATTYTVVGTTGSCVKTLTTMISVNPLPTVTIVNLTPSVCLGSSAPLTAIGASSYSWNTGSTFTTIAVTPTATTVYTVVGTSSLGCSQTATATVYAVCPIDYLGVGYKLKWKNYFGSMYRNDTLMQNPSVVVPDWYPSAISKNTLLPGTNGWVEQVLDSPPVINNLVGFLDSADAYSGTIYDIDFGFHVAVAHDLYAFTSGSFYYLGTANARDTIRIERTGSNYIYKQNSVGLFTVSATSSNLKVKAVVNGLPIDNIGASFDDSTNVRFANYVKPIIETIHTDDGTPYGGISITDGGVSLSPAIGESGYSYTWAPGSATTPAISNKASGVYTVVVKDGLQNSSVHTYGLTYKTKWTTLFGITVHGDTLVSPAGTTYTWNTGVSENIITHGVDGYIRWKVQEINSEKIIGFSQSPSSSADVYSDINDGIRQLNNNLYYISGGSSTFLGYCLPEDQMKIERVGSTLNFYRNATLILSQSASISSSVDWKIKVAVNTAAGFTIRNIGSSWPAPFLCSGYSIQVSPLVACKASSTPFTAQLYLFTTNITPTSNYAWTPTPAQAGSSASGTFNNTFTTLNAATGFNLSVNDSYNTCSVTNSVNITVSNLTVNAGPDFFLSTFPSASLPCGGAPTAINGIAPYTYSWAAPLAMTPAIPATGSTNPSVNSVTSSFGATPYIVSVTVTDNAGCIVTDALNIYDLTAFSAQKTYAILKKDLDAGYYNTIPVSSHQTLFFMFEEEYYKPGTNNLNFFILDDNNLVHTYPSGLVKKIGDNRFSMDVTLASSSLSSGYYKIYAKNEKNEIWQARFKVN